MGWFCDTPEAIKQMELCEANNCPGCNKCIWIEESGWAKTQYSKPVPDKPHPLLDKIILKFGGTKIE